MSDNSYSSGIFAGHGFLVIFSGDDGHYYAINLSDGNVTDLRTCSEYSDAFDSESWSDWGVAQFDGIDYSVLFPLLQWRDIVRANIAASMANTITNFTSVSDSGQFHICTMEQPLVFSL